MQIHFFRVSSLFHPWLNLCEAVMKLKPGMFLIGLLLVCLAGGCAYSSQDGWDFPPFSREPRDPAAKEIRDLQNQKRQKRERAD